MLPPDPAGVFAAVAATLYAAHAPAIRDAAGIAATPRSTRRATSRATPPWCAAPPVSREVLLCS